MTCQPPARAKGPEPLQREVDDGEGQTGVRVGLAFVVAAAVLVAAYFAFVRSGG